MKMKPGFLLPTIKPVEQFVTAHLLTITFGLSTYDFNFAFGKTYSFVFPCKFGKTENFIFPCEFVENVFLYKKHIRDYIQLYSQPYL